jgi:hypothetical protein
MAKDDPYLSFPISLITGTDKVEIITKCMRFGIGHYAKKLQLEDSAIEDIAHEIPDQGAHGFDENCEDQRFILYASQKLGINLGSVPAVLDLQRHAGQLANGSPRVRLRKDIAFSFRDDKRWRLFDFQVLTAVYSIISNKAFTRTNIDFIAARSTGASGPKTQKAESPTRKAMRNALDKLENAGLFVRVIYQRRHTYYSHSMTQGALAIAVKKLKASKPIRKAMQI